MTIKELVEQVAGNNPAVLSGIPRNKAVALLRTALAQIGKTIKETEDGVVLVPGFGKFQVRQVEREVGGKKVVRKQVVFRQAAAKQSGRAKGED